MLLAFLLVTCKKKTSINVKVYNYALGEPIANATVVLVEKKDGGIFGGSVGCNEIASAATDSNGDCSFDNEKLKSNKKYDYFFGIKEAYGISESYSCGGKTSGFVIKGKLQETILNASYYNGSIKVQYNNLLNPSLPNDTLYVRITSAFYTILGEPYAFGGGGVLISTNTQSSSGYPYSNSFLTNPISTQCGKKIVNVRKIKMGILSTSIDTVKVYPNQTTLVQVNW